MIGWIQGVIQEIVLLYYVVFSPIKGDSHKERLESFYAHQAGGYDDYRKRLLAGREQMLEEVGMRVKKLADEGKTGLTWIDLGCGTGYNVEVMHEKGYLSCFSKVVLVDLSPSLLSEAQKRIEKFGWDNVTTCEGDACSVIPSGLKEGEVDLVTFSYSLTMIPPWFDAISHAKALLRPKTGLLGVADFTVFHKYAPHPNVPSQNGIMRALWAYFFSNDNVYLSQDHIPFLLSKFTDLQLIADFHRLPYFPPFIKSAYYIFIGSPK